VLQTYSLSHVEEIDGSLLVDVEVLGTHGDIDFAPVDFLNR
jgi:hypothetical protein